MPKKPFETFSGLAMPLDRTSVDTDQLIPKQYLTGTQRTDLGTGLFNDWRYVNGDPKCPNPDFVLNFPRYQHASVLIAGDNFGCGSSREHAPWALLAYGFRCVISTSFADIFYNNSIKNGLLAAQVDARTLAALLRDTQDNEGHHVGVSLLERTLTSGNRGVYAFSIAEHARKSLLDGADDIDITLGYAAQINQFEKALEDRFPWLA